MKFKIALVAVLGLAACGGTGVAVSNGVKNGTCNAKTYGYLLGQPQSAVETISFDQPVRITRLGQIASSEYNAERITFTIDKLENVSGIRCG